MTRMSGSPVADAVTRTPTRRRFTHPAWLLADVVGVTAFAAVGRRSHAEGLDLAGIAGTAAPFLAGAAMGWVLARAWRDPSAIVPGGVTTWVAALVGGMAIRQLTDQGTAASFVVVATVALGVVLLGWRGVTAVLRTRDGR